jgi:short-subunit dehydrogenase
MRVADSHVLVTGGSQGIGVEIAAEFARRRARVTVLGRDAARLEAVARQINGNYVQLDLADQSMVGKAIELVEAAGGPVDVLINNAGVAMTTEAVAHHTGDAHHVMAINAVAPMELTRQALLSMATRNRGHIVNVSSLAAVTAVPHLAVYGASKAALHRYTSGVQRELALTKSSVSITLLTLGEVAGTHMMEDVRRSPVISAVSARLARTRALPEIAPHDVARAIVRTVESGKSGHVSVPRRIGPLIGLYNLPSRLQDVVLRGIA